MDGLRPGRFGLWDGLPPECRALVRAFASDRYEPTPSCQCMLHMTEALPCWRMDVKLYYWLAFRLLPPGERDLPLARSERGAILLRVLLRLISPPLWMVLLHLQGFLTLVSR
jgi:hypothetical protein